MVTCQPKDLDKCLRLTSLLTSSIVLPDDLLQFQGSVSTGCVEHHVLTMNIEQDLAHWGHQAGGGGGGGGA